MIEVKGSVAGEREKATIFQRGTNTRYHTMFSCLGCDKLGGQCDLSGLCDGPYDSPAGITAFCLMILGPAGKHSREPNLALCPMPVR